MLINSIKEHALYSPNKKLSDFCPSQWVEKVTGLDDFEELIAQIVFCLNEMKFLSQHLSINLLLITLLFLVVK